jgi:ankyrin repeat protein
LNNVIPFWTNNSACSDKRENQDAALDTGRGRSILGQAEQTSLTGSNNSDILGEPADTVSSPAGTSSKAVEAFSTASYPDDDAPPSYTTTTASTSSSSAAATLRSSGGSGGGGMSSLTNSFKALMSGFKSKPEPFVSALCQAAQHANIHQMAGLVKSGVNVNGRNEDGKTALQMAIAGDHADAARLLLASGADWGPGQKYKSLPPLFYAASLGSVATGKLLLDRGAKVDEKSISGQPYFYNVVKEGNMEGVMLLLAHGADANVQSISGEPCLIKALKSGRPQLVDVLLENGADADATDISGNSALSVAAALKEAPLEMVRVLLRHGVDVAGASTVTGPHPVTYAITNQQLDMAELLLRSGAPGDATDVTGVPMVWRVVKTSKLDEREKTDLLALLLEHGASPDAEDISGNTCALKQALRNGEAAVAELLIRHGAELDVKTSSSTSSSKADTLLIHAINHGQHGVIKALLDRGVNPSDTDDQGMVPLVLALSKQDVEAARLLRDEGVQIDAGNEATIRDLANLLHRPDYLDLLGVVGEGSSSAGTSGAGSGGQQRGMMTKAEEAREDAVPRPETPPPGYE